MSALPTRSQLRSKWLLVPTPRQLHILAFIRDYALAHGYPPTMREIASTHGIASTQGVSDHIKALLRKGLLTTVPANPRTMTLTDAGRGALAAAAETRP